MYVQYLTALVSRDSFSVCSRFIGWIFPPLGVYNLLQPVAGCRVDIFNLRTLVSRDSFSLNDRVDISPAATPAALGVRVDF
jgi:hypothetical protein